MTCMGLRRSIVEFPWLLFLGIGSLFARRGATGSLARISQPIGGAARAPPSRGRAFEACVLKNFIKVH